MANPGGNGHALAQALEMPQAEQSARLFIQPDDSAGPLVEGIDGAKKSVDILVFRMDRPEVEQALVRAAGRQPLERDTLYNIVNTFDGADGNGSAAPDTAYQLQ